MSSIGRTGGFTPIPDPTPDPVLPGGASTTASGGSATAATSGSASPGNRTTTASAGAAATTDIWAAITRGPGTAPTAPGVNLDASGARRPVALGNNGRFTSVPGRDATTPAAIADGMFNAASLIDDSKENLFDTIRMSPQGRTRMLANLKTDLDSVKVGARPPAGMTDLQALQARSSGATVLLELMTSKGTPDAQKREAFALYMGALKAETNPTLKDGMALHLHRLRDALPADLKTQIDGAKEIAAPQKPPYDAWFKNGKSNVNVNWSAGSESMQDDISLLKKNGFTVKSESYDKTVLQRTYTVDGKKTTFDVTIRPFRTDMFKEMGDPNANMVIYTGHSGWGKNVRDSLGAAPAASGKDKLILNDLCVGKGEMNMIRDKFPESQLITTFTSSYFIESEGGANEPDSEGIHAVLNTFEGIAARKGYEAIAEDVRDANPWQGDHDLEGIDNNFIFPTDIATRRKNLDIDHDGQADVYDRLIDFSTTNVAEDTAREFKAIDQPRPAGSLLGTKLHSAAMTVNRLTIYSEVYSPKNSDSKVVPGGFYEPKAGETGMFRFQKTKLDGKDAVVMQMSSKFAHMSEEALRMASCFEYARYMATQGGRRMSAADVNLSGMVLASHSLATDQGYRDDAVWQEFLKAYNLPTVPRGEFERVKEIDHDWYSGSFQSITELNRTLSADTKTKLGQASAGKMTIR